MPVKLSPPESEPAAPVQGFGDAGTPLYYLWVRLVRLAVRLCPRGQCYQGLNIPRCDKTAAFASRRDESVQMHQL
jgi:hypothetical protein